METGYNGIIRQLLKLFLNNMEADIKQLLLLKQQNKSGYLIAIFE